MNTTETARDALLIAVGAYSNPTLSKLRSPTKDAEALAAVLADSDIGRFRVSQAVDQPSYQIMQTIERFFTGRSRADTLLLHMSCHGIRDEEGALYFAASNTDRELIASTAVSSEFLKLQLRRCRARSIVVLLDCCFSGAFLSGIKSDPEVHVAEEISGLGIAVLTATTRTEYAWEGDNLLPLEPASSRFTAEIIDGIRSGDADRDGDGRIAVDELYDHVYERLRQSRALQTPQMWAQLQHRIFIAEARTSLKHRNALRSANSEAGTDPIATQEVFRSGRDIQIHVELTLSEAAFGFIRKITFDTKVVCESCGELSLEDSRGCPVCHGARRVSVLRTITVRFPKGLEHDTRIHLEGEGDVGRNGAAAGDIYLVIIEQRHPLFRRDQDDLRMKLSILESVAASGGITEVNSLDGIVKLRIPPGARAGTIFRVPDRGVPHLHSAGRGDLLVELMIQDD
jgi:molecular chaperone DnaJ